ncbi:hypothetical protein GMORB2_3558 [Geosmithia morbida]|uniref:Uncharacterized protein n=1 Tax=Geosmithia morbida TaxID=1094350 RepID=A0A9P5D1I4_9HYPO|nr:uncharacterized protein GMORB2_3558 [Geosmithia morbida]KAF4119870.1 hypothetical protein GMORB2_3558 [Geosmithia morbida]
MPPPIAAWSRSTKVKAGIWAGAFGAIVIVGSLTGAQLKQDKQKEQKIRQFRETTPEEQIAALQDQRNSLVGQRDMLQRKVDLFKERRREREADRERRREASMAKAADPDKS